MSCPSCTRCEVGVRGQCTNVLGEFLAHRGVLQARWHVVNSEILHAFLEILTSEIRRYSPILALYTCHICSVISSNPSSVHLEFRNQWNRRFSDHRPSWFSSRHDQHTVAFPSTNSVGQNLPDAYVTSSCNFCLVFRVHLSTRSLFCHSLENDENSNFLKSRFTKSSGVRSHDWWYLMFSQVFSMSWFISTF